MTITAERFVSMLNKFVQHKIEKIVANENLRNLWLQQDGTTAHTARDLLTVLKVE